MRHPSRTIVLALGLLVLVLVPPAAAALDQPFYIDLFRRMMIFAIAALSLDLILGYGGMVSFGHAVYLGIGAYAVGILAFYGVDNGFLQWAVAIAASAVVALVIGGIGSIRGALVGAILVGMVDTLGRAFLRPLLSTMVSPNAADAAGPALASILIYVLMAAVLFLRPQGLFPARG